jgi:hypothetical protein
MNMSYLRELILPNNYNNYKSLYFNDASLAHLPPPWNYDTSIGSNSRYNRALPRTEEFVA